jgi:hypothetical protein
MAARCGLSREELENLGLPIAEDGRFLVFDFPETGARKLRGTGEGKKEKQFLWSGPVAPPLWPVPTSPGEEVVVCEGEADAICLVASEYEAYSITKGSASETPVAVWESLRDHGVTTVRLVFDADDAGRRGRAAAAEGARAAGLHVLESRIVGIQPLLGEKDARDVVARAGYPLEVEDDADEDAPVLLSDVEAMLPEPLLLGKLHAQEHSILFGDGGTGKGVIAAWLAARLTRDGRTVLIVDYEYHMNYEWRPRVEGFGGDMEAVGVLQPVRPIWDISGWLRTQAEPYDYVIIDSVTYACVGEEVEKSVTATRYTAAVNQLGKPVLSIAHVTKQNADPNHPFGSIFWSNGARVTIAVSRQRPEDPESPRLVRNPKTNQRGPFPPVLIDWSWLGQDGPPGCTCSKPPPDQVGMRHHLHETSMAPSQTQMVRDARAALLAKLGREPSSTETHGAIVAEYADKAPPLATVKARLSSIVNSDRVVRVRKRGVPQDDDGAV